MPMDPAPVQGIGSAVIVDAAGYILTNHHVVADADEVVVTLHNGQEKSAVIVGVGPGPVRLQVQRGTHKRFILLKSGE